MTVTPKEFQGWLTAKENEHLEFKEAKSNFHFEKLVKYCVALANEGGGKLILGVSDRRPRKVVGSRAFQEMERTRAGLIERLRLKIDAEELAHPDGRVVIFSVPPRPLGVPIQYEGAYWMRAGEDLRPMTQDMLKRIFNEAGPDFSAELCPNATLADLDSAAVNEFRARWHRKSGNASIRSMTVDQLLSDTELTTAGGVTYAALILLGTRRALDRLLPQAEVIFEYRSGEPAGPAQQRIEYRQGFFLFQDDIWKKIDLRNDVQHFQDGLFILDIPTFSEAAGREAILNAVCHRDYRMAGSIFVRQFPRRLEVVSPGGLPPGITADNILWRQSPRNRRIAEVLAKCGLVERSGQGIDRMYEEAIRQGKPLPDFSGTDEYQVALTLYGEIQDTKFLRFFEKIQEEIKYPFDTRDLLVLDLVHRDQPIPQLLKPRLTALTENGILEKLSRGKGVRYFLSRRFYQFIGKKGVYTRKKGLDRDTNKELLARHIHENAADGSRLNEFMQVLPGLNRRQVQSLLFEMKADGRVRLVGTTRSARWYPVADSKS